MRLGFIAALGLAFSASAAVACPSANSAGLGQFEADRPRLSRGMGFRVTGGGTNNLANCGAQQPAGGGGNGFFLTPPHVTLALDEVVRRNLIVGTITEGSCNPVILVRSPGGSWFWNDNARNNDAQVVVPVDTDGAMNIWVGSADGSPCDTRVVIRLHNDNRDRDAPGGGDGEGGGGGGSGGHT